MGPTKSPHPGYAADTRQGTPRTGLHHLARARRHYRQVNPTAPDGPIADNHEHALPGKHHADELEVGQWRIDADPTGELTGHVEMLTLNREQARLVQRTLTNVAVEIHTQVIPLRISGDALVAATSRRI